MPAKLFRLCFVDTVVFCLGLDVFDWGLVDDNLRCLLLKGDAVSWSLSLLDRVLVDMPYFTAASFTVILRLTTSFMAPFTSAR